MPNIGSNTGLFTADLESPINLLEKIDKDAGWHLWDLIKMRPGGEPSRKAQSSAEVAQLPANPLGAPVHPDKDPSSWLVLLHLLSQQKSPSSLDAAKGVAGSLGWPHTCFSPDGAAQLPGKAPSRMQS